VNLNSHKPINFKEKRNDHNGRLRSDPKNSRQS
jgi:hypothetical protein